MKISFVKFNFWWLWNEEKSECLVNQLKATLVSCLLLSRQEASLLGSLTIIIEVSSIHFVISYEVKIKQFRENFYKAKVPLRNSFHSQTKIYFWYFSVKLKFLFSLTLKFGIQKLPRDTRRQELLPLLTQNCLFPNNNWL